MSAPRREAAIAGLLLIVAGCAVAFVVAYAADAGTQALGLTLGAALLALAAALGAAGAWLLPSEISEEPRRPPAAQDDERKTVAGAPPGGRFDHAAAAACRDRRCRGRRAGGCGRRAARISRPVMGDTLVASPWRRGTRLVDVEGQPIAADALDAGGFLTAFPAGADIDATGSPIVVVRVDPRQLRLPEARRAWAPDGLVAYSKICTHAGCAVSMLRSPLFSAHVPGPALVCPCHYSTFDVTDGGTVLFGPAGRPLPQLPLSIRADGTVAAAGPLSGDVGPAWFGTRAPGRSGGW